MQTSNWMFIIGRGVVWNTKGKHKRRDEEGKLLRVNTLALPHKFAEFAGIF